MDNENIQRIRELRREKLQWSLEENSFRNRRDFKQKDFGFCGCSFSDCADAVFRESVFGVYLKSLNEKEHHDSFLNENKLGITQWDLMRYSDDELKEFSEKNLLTDDLYDLLLTAVKSLEVIDWSYLHDSLVSLRLSNCSMQWLDDGLRKFKYIVVLILTGNFLQKLPGVLLPRKIQFLELYANEISEIASLVSKAPKRILHIGLGRNKLSQVNDCHLLSTSRNFRGLRTLDLSDNDFVDLQALVATLSTLQHLQSLNLEGNPCSVCVSYKDAVMEYLPRLVYLDNVELLQEDRKIIDASILKNAILVFTCHRITGLRAPPKEKNAKQTIHIEVRLPLLEELDLAELDPEPVEEEAKEEPPCPPPPSLTESRSSHGSRSKKNSQQSKKSKMSLKSKSSIKSLDRKSDKSLKSKSSSKSKSSKSIKVKEPGPYDAPDEYERESKLHLRNPSFKTERTSWSKMMQFPEESVVVETSESDLIKVRDTFRSCVEVKVVYLVTTTPSKPKKAKKGGKEKKKDKKAKGKGSDKKGGKKDKKKGENKQKVEQKKTEEPQKPEEPDYLPEIVLKKITLVKFKCDLHSVNWSDKTIDFYWAQHKEVGENAIPVEGSLRAIVYAEGKTKEKEKKETNKKEKKGKQKASTSTAAPTEDDGQATGRQKVPNYITVQVGFGLRRSHFPKIITEQQ